MDHEVRFTDWRSMIKIQFRVSRALPLIAPFRKGGPQEVVRRLFLFPRCTSRLGTHPDHNQAGCFRSESISQLTRKATRVCTFNDRYHCLTAST